MWPTVPSHKSEPIIVPLKEVESDTLKRVHFIIDLNTALKKGETIINVLSMFNRLSPRISRLVSSGTRNAETREVTGEA